MVAAINNPPADSCAARSENSDDDRETFPRQNLEAPTCCRPFSGRRRCSNWGPRIRHRPFDRIGGRSVSGARPRADQVHYEAAGRGSALFMELLVLVHELLLFGGWTANETTGERASEPVPYRRRAAITEPADHHNGARLLG